MPTPSNLNKFKTIASKYKGTCIKSDICGAKDKTFQCWASMPEGGCGIEGCNCSPGWWVSASEKGKYINVVFQHEGTWTRFKKEIKKEFGLKYKYMLI